MPRKNRVHYRNAYHHVMLRGNNRANIFSHLEDYQCFNKYLKNALDLYSANLHLYCLMTNHIHLVIEVTDVPLSKIMQSVTSSYAKKHNKTHNKVGHVFQGRYVSKLIQDDQYLIALCYYIHMNPVKAKMCQSPNEYLWSSHHAYMKNHKDPVHKEIVTHHIDNLLLSGGLDYDRFIQSYKNGDMQSVSCAFDEEGILAIKDNTVLKMQNRRSLALENISVKTITKLVCEHLGVNPEDLSTGSLARKHTFARAMIAYFGHYHAKYTLDEIAAYFSLQRGSMSKTMHRYLKMAKVDKKVSNVILALEGKLSSSDVDK